MKRFVSDVTKAVKSDDSWGYWFLLFWSFAAFAIITRFIVMFRNLKLIYILVCIIILWYVVRYIFLRSKPENDNKNRHARYEWLQGEMERLKDDMKREVREIRSNGLTEVYDKMLDLHESTEKLKDSLKMIK